MTKILFGSLLAMAFIILTGCSGADANSTSDVNSSKSSKCGEGKCGADKKASKCGGDKKAEDAMKCGGDKK